MTAVHVSPFSGSWYPQSATELRTLLDGLFERSRGRAPFLFPAGLGFVVPHAGPAYSGTVAAAAYRAIEQLHPERVVLLAFPHRGGLQGVAAPDVAAISTPLGQVPVDPAFGGFPMVPEDRVCDHSFEIQLPFLQCAAPQARITPLYVGRMDAAGRSAAARSLAALFRPGVVFAASSDFTHYGPSFGFTPFPPDPSGARLRTLDFECIEAAASLDSTQFLATLQENRATVCGAAPIALLLDALRLVDPGIYQATLDYQTSADVTEDFRNSVSYAALGFFPRSAFHLDAADRDALLTSAAETLRHLRQSHQSRAFPALAGSPSLRARRGVFVSLHRGPELLGCVGRTEGRAPLSEEVADLTLAAAQDDPRFRPAASMSGPIDIEISVLTPFRRIRTAAECTAGKHGLFLKLGARAGLLLPQVAAERRWTTEEFLQAVSRKAQLPPTAWRAPQSRLYVFEAQVWSTHSTPAPLP